MLPFSFCFAITRHPIYTGALIAGLGTAMTDGRVRSFIVVVLVTAGFAFKLSKEEKLMSEHFGDEHRHYRARVSRLIPFVW
ncbi:MAG: methyltransferase [Polyangiaceae bacterium]